MASAAAVICLPVFTPEAGAFCVSGRSQSAIRFSIAVCRTWSLRRIASRNFEPSGAIFLQLFRHARSVFLNRDLLKKQFQPAPCAANGSIRIRHRKRVVAGPEERIEINRDGGPNQNEGYFGVDVGRRVVIIIHPNDDSEKARFTRSGSGVAAANSEDTTVARSTDLHIEAIRLTSLTAGPTTVKSSRSSLPMLPKKNSRDWTSIPGAIRV